MNGLAGCSMHLPLQSGSDGVLRRMARRCKTDEFEALVKDARAQVPGFNVTTDIIVGFPGETEEDFQATLDLVRKVRYASLYAFKYSPRPGTAAPRLKVDEVEREVADRRLQELFAVQQEIQSEINQTLVGDTFEVLVTNWGKKPGTQTGRTSCHRLIHFPYGDQPLEMGSLTRVQVKEALPHSLLGHPPC